MFQFQMVRLKDVSNQLSKSSLSKFQFQMVRLKGNEVKLTSITAMFQFQMVRLKAFSVLMILLLFSFQFQMVRLKALSNGNIPFVSVGFNSKWYD